MRRGCLVAVVLATVAILAAWAILNPRWLDERATFTQRLELRSQSGAERDGKDNAVAADPDLFGPARLAIPVAGVRPDQLTDTFNQTRGEGRRHQALDIMAPLGTPVIAAAPGLVEKLFVSQAGGNTVYVRSPGRRTIFYYAHLDRYAPSLAEGQAVRTGTPLGTVGFTGNADPAGPHLHFAIFATKPERRWHDAATPINPYQLLGGP